MNWRTALAALGLGLTLLLAQPVGGQPRGTCPEVGREATPVDGTPESRPRATPVAVLDGVAIATPVATKCTIVISDFSFDRPFVEIPVDTTVMWINADSLDHQVVAFDGEFDSFLISPGANFQHTFSSPGFFPYRDPLYPAMDEGTIVVVLQ